MESKDRPMLRGWKLYLFLYFLLLSASHLYLLLSSEPTVNPSKNYQDVTENSINAQSDTKLKIAYSDSEIENSEVILFLTDIPLNTSPSPLIDSLNANYRTIIPDYIGFGDSDIESINLSMAAQAKYIDQLLININVQNVHIVANGFGGGVALQLYDLLPDRISSLTMVEALGVQELELLGGYHLNYAIHGARLASIWVLQNAIPHFGLMKNSFLTIEYAKSYYESDQRPLRDILGKFEAPMLIIDGIVDNRVKTAAAEEHYRLVPQSKLEFIQRGYDIIESDVAESFILIRNFLTELASGSKLDKSQADSVRIQASIQEYIPSDELMLSGYALGLVMILIVLATLVSEDLTCIGAGLMVARGIIGHAPAIIACLIGIFLGDILIYFLGRWLGRSAIRRKPFSWFINEHDLDRSYQWFELKGPIIIIASRFVPGSRFPTYFTAGAIGASFFMFIIYFGIASIIWTPILVETAYLVGNNMIEYFEVYQEYALWVLLGILALFMFIFKVLIPSFTFRGRRLLFSRYKRFINWEFWPIPIIYLPVFIYSIILSIKYRSFTMFTAANPAIEHGGFKNESKSDILEKLKVDDIALFEVIEGNAVLEDKMDQVHAFIDLIDTSFPIVIKPVTGERGAGVRIVKDELLLEKALKFEVRDVIVQEYIPGKEFGIFYYRYPGSDVGKIFSITEKSMPKLIGDGKHTLEHLILKDSRAVCLAEYHIDHHADHIFDIPDDGEVIHLVELGTHARGSIFYDGMKYKTSDLEQRIDEIAKEFDGFQFGRFDIRVPSIDDLKHGKNYKVIELNGVTSESTHIYHPGYSIWNAWKTLIRQWEIAYQIGFENAALGHKPSSLKALLSTLTQENN